MDDQHSNEEGEEAPPGTGKHSGELPQAPPGVVTNCDTCQHRPPASVANACWLLCGHPPAGAAGVEHRKRADQIRQWRTAHDLPTDDKVPMQPGVEGCPGWELAWIPFHKRHPDSGQVVEYRLHDLCSEPGPAIRRGLWDGWRRVMYCADRGGAWHHLCQLAVWRPAPPGPFVDAPDRSRLDLGTPLGRSLALCWIAQQLSPGASLGVSLDISRRVADNRRIRCVTLYADEEVYIYPRPEDDRCYGDPEEEPAPIVPGLQAIDARLSPPLLHPLLVEALWRGLMP